VTLRPFRRAYLAAWRWTHRGNARSCPACGTRAARFAPYGVTRRPDAQCPGCGSLERHRALWLYLREQTDLLARPVRVLAVAPDAYLDEQAQRLPWDYLSIDLVPGRAMREMDVTRLDLPRGDRDLVIAYHVLEHVIPDGAAMNEIRRVLRADGQALIEVPLEGEETDEELAEAPPAERAQRYGQPDHVRLYGRADFKRRLVRAGLEPEEVRVGDLFGDRVELFGLVADERFFVARPTVDGAAGRATARSR
jgi:SAM-dependent methyltransferase